MGVFTERCGRTNNNHHDNNKFIRISSTKEAELSVSRGHCDDKGFS